MMTKQCRFLDEYVLIGLNDAATAICTPTRHPPLRRSVLAAAGRYLAELRIHHLIHDLMECAESV